MLWTQWISSPSSVGTGSWERRPVLTFVSAKRRLESFVLGRSEWCISRQRSWGVPIPVLYEVGTGDAHLSVETLNHIIPILAAKGTDYWWSDDVDAFIPPHLKATGKVFRKGTDTMDVWFDSGSSWTLIKELGLRSAAEPVADVYLEGSDQHRGWFQSSLLTHLASTEGGKDAAHAPYRTLITHGMVLDQDGQKMSKSLGNGLTPMEVIHGGKVGQRTNIGKNRNWNLISTGQEKVPLVWNRCNAAMGRPSRLHA